MNDMDKKNIDKILVIFTLLLLIVSVIFFSYIAGDAKETVEEDDDTNDMLDATKAFLASGKTTMITAEALYANLNDNYAGNDPFILSIRSEEQYDLGHIPGAVNIPFRSVFTEENLTKLPMNKQIVVYCYTGHTASQITALLNVQGYDAACLKWGMCSWTSNATIAPKWFDKATSAGNFPVSQGTDPGTFTSAVTVGSRCGGDEPVTSTEPVEASDDVDLREGIHNYLASGKSPVITADSLNTLLTDGDTENDPFILSIRSASISIFLLLGPQLSRLF